MREGITNEQSISLKKTFRYLEKKAFSIFQGEKSLFPKKSFIGSHYTSQQSVYFSFEQQGKWRWRMQLLLEDKTFIIYDGQPPLQVESN